MMVRVQVSPQGIGELVRLNWLDVRQIQSPAAVADAVVEVANAALDAYLRPV
jgi:hypothetical protein